MEKGTSQFEDIFNVYRLERACLPQTTTTHSGGNDSFKHFGRLTDSHSLAARTIWSNCPVLSFRSAKNSFRCWIWDIRCRWAWVPEKPLQERTLGGWMGLNEKGRPVYLSICCRRRRLDGKSWGIKMQHFIVVSFAGYKSRQMARCFYSPPALALSSCFHIGNKSVYIGAH